MFKELGYDDEAAFALAGACWVESRWDCHAVNRDEVAGKNKNTGSGWNNAGEGYFLQGHFRRNDMVNKCVNGFSVCFNSVFARSSLIWKIYI